MKTISNDLNETTILMNELLLADFDMSVLKVLCTINVVFIVCFGEIHVVVPIVFVNFKHILHTDTNP